MRNLKKFLALVLAMIMAMSLMVTANASTWNSFTDETITEEFHEAVDVLAGLKVFQGQNVGGEIKFNPTAPITRAEVATVIYRIATGDVNDNQASLYKQYARFSDVSENAWYAGYVGYDSNAEIIKGSNGRFYPDRNVTGFQVLAMILRTIGYDENGEFTGAGWEVRVASTAEALGILENLNETRYNGTLSQPANREVVAELLFQTLVKVPRVQWTEALGYYNQKDQLNGGNYNPTQGQYIFGLNAARTESRDVWGRPIRKYLWTQNGRLTATYTSVGGNNGWLYKDPNGHPIYTVTNNVVTSYDISPKPDKTYYTAVLECDVAHDLDIEIAEEFELYVNGDSNLATPTIDPIDADYRIQATDTTTKVGGQGRLTEFYLEDGICVMIDTMLARVNTVTPATVDRNGHVIVPAQMEVTIYDGPNKTNTVAGGQTSTSNRTISKPVTTADPWEYSKGEFILLNAYTNKSARTTSTQRESAAFETDKVVLGSDMDNSVVENENLTINNGVWINKENGKNGVAEHFTGKQTVVSTNTGKHIVDGNSYDDQLCLFLDRAQNVTNTSFEWYLDQYGNLIGIGDANKTNFGVITDIYAALDQGTNNTTGGVKAVATVKFADGSVGQVVIDRFNMSVKTSGVSAGAVVANDGSPTDINTVAGAYTDAGVALQGGANTVDLVPVYDTASSEPLSVSVPNPTFTPVNAGNIGWLNLAVSTSTNWNAHFAVNGSVSNSEDVFGILYNHMFEFVTASDNSVIAVEVAGINSTTPPSNTGIYEGNANAIVSNPDAGGNANTAGGKLFKSTAWLTLNNTPGATAAGDVYLNENTQILIRVGNRVTSTTINAYTISTLPGDVDIPLDSEVDWADVDGDGRADYVYINFGNMRNVIDYALFYFNEGEASWDGATGTGYAMGRLNGSKQDVRVEFNNLAQYTSIVYNTSYMGHLYALQLTNNVVSDVMLKGNDATTASSTAWTNELLKTWDGTDWQNTTCTAPTPAGVNNPLGTFGNTDNDAASGNIRLSTDVISGATLGANIAFQLGVPANEWGTNPYSATTAAVYYYDVDSSTAGTTDLRYERVSGGYKVIAYDENDIQLAEYWISPNATVVGTLEWLNTRVNYVTMVYESNNANAIMEIYITPIPDVTPSTPSGVPDATRVLAGPNVTFPGNAPALDAAVESGQRDIVVYDPNELTTNVNLLATFDGNEDAEDLIYFPFTMPAQNATLTIRNAETNDLVYSETLPYSNGGLVGSSDVHCFVIDFTSATANGGYAPGLPMKSGVTYTFTIVGADTVTYSTGSFTMGR